MEKVSHYFACVKPATQAEEDGWAVCSVCWVQIKHLCILYIIRNNLTHRNGYWKDALQFSPEEAYTFTDLIFVIFY